MKKASVQERYNDIFSTTLRNLMDENSTKQADLAKFCNVQRQSISQWQNGNTRPDINSLWKIAEFYHVSTDYLLGRTSVQTTDTNLRSVCDYTGLSEQAISKLKTYQKENKSEWSMDVFNAMIENENFDTLFSLICQFATRPDHQVEYRYIRTSLYDIEESKAQNTLHDIMQDLQTGFQHREDNRIAYQRIFSLHETGKLSDEDYKQIEHEFDNGDFSALKWEET